MPSSTAHPCSDSAAAPLAPARLQRLAALGQCLLQHLDTPLAVADARGVVLEANAALARRIERCDGLWLDAGGRLAVCQCGRWVPVSRWQPEIAAGRRVVLSLEADGVPMQLMLEPLHAGDAAAGGCGVLVRIEHLPPARGDTMRRRFRFTRTQARLAELLCAGMRPVHAAQVLGVKISTVRTHVGEMYEKTGTHSQAQLVALMHAG